MVCLNDIIETAARGRHDRPAFTEVDVDGRPGPALTYGEFVASARGIAAALRSVAPDAQVISLVGHSSIDWMVTEFALSLNGTTCVPLYYRLSNEEMNWQVRDSASAVVVTLEGFDETASLLRSRGHHVVSYDELLAAKPASPPPTQEHRADAETVQRIMYTSATTGRPKGVLTTHGQMVDNVVTILANQLRDVTSESVFLAATPLTHMSIGYAWPFLAAGAHIAILPKFQADSFVTALENNSVTHTLLVPTMIRSVLDQEDSDAVLQRRIRRSSIKNIWVAGAPMPEAVLRRAIAAFDGKLNQQYGLTELWSSNRSMCAAAIYSHELADKPASCGRPMIGVHVRIDHDEESRVGEILVANSTEPRGYLNNEAANREVFRDGWTRTGDVGYLDDDGYLFVVDRKKDVIISGGLNIYPAEIEAVINTFPGVSQSAVVGAPSERWGETPLAFLTMQDGASLSAAELTAFLRERLAHYKVPTAFSVLDELPKGPTGKIRKKDLRETRER